MNKQLKYNPKWNRLAYLDYLDTLTFDEASSLIRSNSFSKKEQQMNALYLSNRFITKEMMPIIIATAVTSVIMNCIKKVNDENKETH